MTITCTTSGAWDAIAGANAYLSKQQWQAAFLFVLCQLKAAVNGESSMSSCSVAGAWDAVQGNGFKTDQEFYKESLNTLCGIATAIAAAGGSIGSGAAIVRDAPSNPEPPPPNQAVVTLLRFRDGSAGLTWDNVLLQWF